jgi:hypothetical protein
VGFCEAEAEALVTVAEYAAAAQRLRDSLRVDLLPDTPLARQARLRLRLGVCHRLQAGDEDDAELHAKALQCFAHAHELCEQAASAERRVGGAVSEETTALGLEVRERRPPVGVSVRPHAYDPNVRDSHSCVLGRRRCLHPQTCPLLFPNCSTHELTERTFRLTMKQVDVTLARREGCWLSLTWRLVVSHLRRQVSFELGCASERADDHTAACQQFVRVVSAAGALDADGRAALEGELKGQRRLLLRDERATLARVSELYQNAAPGTRTAGGETRLWRVLAWEGLRAYRSGRLSNAEDTWGLRLAGVERQTHDPSSGDSVVRQTSLERSRAAEESTVVQDEHSTPLASQHGVGSTSIALLACAVDTVGEADRAFALSVG